MSNKKCLLIFYLMLILLMTGCKKKDVPAPAPILKSFSFPANTDLIIDLTWTANGKTNGYDFVDLQLVIDDEVTSPYFENYVDANSGRFQSVTVRQTDINNSYKVGFVYFYNHESMVMTIEYTIKVYPVGNISAAKTYTGNFKTLTTLTPNPSNIYYELGFVKSNSLYEFNELAAKTTFNRAPYIPY